MINVTLKTDVEMPMLGLRTWKSDPSEVKGTVYEALKSGYRQHCAVGTEKEIMQRTSFITLYSLHS
jgi:diketogulonate reductase-like aldo/keto reductase